MAPSPKSLKHYKIGFIANSSWNLYNFRRTLIESLQERGHEVYAIAPPDSFCHQLEGLGCTYIPVKMSVKGTNPIQDLKLTFDLNRIYRKYDLDYVLHYTIKPNIYGTLATIFYKKPNVINNVTGLGTVFLRDSFTSKIARELYRFAFRYPDHIFFQNEDDRQLFLKKGLAPKEKTGLVPGSGIDLDYFRTQTLLPKGENFTFLMIARLLYDKGIEEYIGAIRLLKKQGVKARFQLLGKINEEKGLGVSKATVQSWVDEGLVEYLGVVDDVRPVIEASSCIVLPSYREGTPRTLLEAAAMSRPIVATDVPGCRETVRLGKGQNGFLCKAKSEESLAKAMLKMYQLSGDDCQQMGQNSRKFIEEKFDVSIVIRQYNKVMCLPQEEKAEKPVYYPRVNMVMG